MSKYHIVGNHVMAKLYLSMTITVSLNDFPKKISFKENILLSGPALCYYMPVTTCCYYTPFTFITSYNLWLFFHASWNLLVKCIKLLL